MVGLFLHLVLTKVGLEQLEELLTLFWFVNLEKRVERYCRTGSAILEDGNLIRFCKEGLRDAGRCLL